MGNRLFGYLRVSSKEQNEARQKEALIEFGIPEENLFTDKQTGKDFNRPAYKRLLRKLRPNDTLVVKSIDRFGRNYKEILEQWRVITQVKQVAVVVLDMPLLDTRNKNDLTGTLLANLSLELLSYVAQIERDFIHQRQAEGIVAAKRRGVKFGRPPMKRTAQFERLRSAWREDRISARQAAKELQISHVTFLRWAREES